VPIGAEVEEAEHVTRVGVELLLPPPPPPVAVVSPQEVGADESAHE